MAYPTVSAPYGLRPVQLIGGQVFAGSTRLLSIASGSGTSIYFGDVVKLISSGTVEKDAGTDAATPLGLFMGCTFTDPNSGQLVWKQYYPATTVASNIMAYVVDDPDALFKVAVVSATTTVGGVLQTALGNNAVLVQNAGSTITGDSAVGISSTTATTSTWPLRIVDLVPDTMNSSGSYTEVIVKWNAGMHTYNNPTGT